MDKQNLFSITKLGLQQEQFDELTRGGSFRLERIASTGQASPPEGEWYDQEEDEWVLLLRGRAVLTFDDGSSISLQPGDYLNLPAHLKHRVAWTDPEQETVWLTLHYRPDPT